jgi:hypothetical protein
MSSEHVEDHDAKTPVNEVRLSGSLRQFIIDDCVLCGETHRHGSLDATVAKGGRSHRIAHCGDGGGYYLELADDADPPERWYSWLESETGFDRGDIV